MPYGASKHDQEKTLKSRLKPSLPISRPAKETKNSQATISTSAILRRKPMKEVYGKKHSRSYGMRKPQHDLFLDYQDQVEASRSELVNSSHAALRSTHSDLTTALAELEVQDTNFRSDVEAQCQYLFVPITEETVETNFKRDGKSVSETFQVGQQIEAFKAMLIAKEAELALYWAEWEKVQARIVQLGVEVLGAEAFEGGGADGPREKQGYMRDLEELDLQHQVWLKEMDEEIQLIGEESFKKMLATEKELDATLRKQQASFIAQVFANND